MEKERVEEIIGYRIGQCLFCPDCYHAGARSLKSSQNPEDPEVKFPSRPVTAEDVSIFICEDCKGIKGPSGGEVKIQERKNLPGLEDMLEDCKHRVAFLSDFFLLRKPEDEFFSDDGLSGLHFILLGIWDDLRFVTKQLEERRHNGSIIEKKGELNNSRGSQRKNFRDGRRGSWRGREIKNHL